jgi:hypothetical protein
LTLKPIIECQNKRLSDAYKETNDNSTNPPPQSAPEDGKTQSGGADGFGPLGWPAAILSLIAIAGGTAMAL